ncbi:GNAT family N-acetyltransferase [Methylocella silvestris]|uniref:GNAT family N-acetyltransferase n=1 Tax=Methylocella silvestris TaxID=199596 RepID=UPI001FCA9EF5|nr:GNAT family N-acetyltransferase [Methylocella silvestris]
MRQAFRHLDAETVYKRFLNYKTNVTEAELEHITGVDFVHDVSLLVTTRVGDEEIVIGGASYFGLDDNNPPHRAEVAFTIEEDFQGQGLARALMRKLVELAKANGVGVFEAEVLANNLAMLSVFKGAGLPLTVRREDGVIHVTIDLRQPPG